MIDLPKNATPFEAPEMMRHAHPEDFLMRRRGAVDSWSRRKKTSVRRRDNYGQFWPHE